MKLSDIHTPLAWTEVADRAAAQSAPTLILGAVDTGKSTLSHHILGRLIEERGTAALLDGDIAMTTVGPSGLLGLTLVGDVDALDDRPGPDRSWFIGDSSPAGHHSRVLVGHARLAAVAREAQVPLVINGSGYVDGGDAKELQLGLADLLQPGLVIGLQRDGEIEHLLVPLERRGMTVVRLEPSPRARAKPRAERSQRRGERFAAALEGAERRTIDLRTVGLEGTLFGTGRSLADEEQRASLERGLDAYLLDVEEAGTDLALLLSTSPHAERAEVVARELGRTALSCVEASETNGLLVGLASDDGDCMAVGVIEAWEDESTLAVHTTLDEGRLKTVRRVLLGSLRLARTGEEQGRWGGEQRLGAISEDPAAAQASVEGSSS